MLHALSTFLVAISLFFVPYAAQQFELPKWALLLFFVSVMLVWIPFMMRRSVWSIRQVWERTPWQLWLFLVVIFLHSCFISMLPDESIWGSYQRHTGAVTWLLQFLLFAIIVGRQWTEREVGHVLRAVAIAGTLAGVVGIMQWLVPGLWDDLIVTGGRVFGTIGVPNFFGQLLLMTVCVTILPFFEDLHARRKTTLVWSAILVIQMVALMLSGNRASLFVLVVLGLIGMTIFLWKLTLSTDRRILATLVLLAVVGTSVVAIASRSDGFYRSISTRLELYPAATSAILERPFLGYGLDTVYTVFTPRLPENLGQTENLLDIPDKVHHILLDTLIEVGLVGAILLGMLIVAIIMQGIQSMRNEKGAHRRYAATIMLSLVAWSLSLMVSFPGMTERVFATVLIALLFVQISDTTSSRLEQQVKHFSVYISSAICFLLGIGALIVGAGIFTADILFAQMRAGHRDMDLALLQQMSPVYREYLVFGSNGVSNGLSPEVRVDFLSRALAKNPDDIWALTFRAQAYHDAGDASGALSDLRSAYALCPGCPFVAVQGAKITRLQGDVAASHAWAEVYFQLLPAFVTQPPESLTPDIQNRRRITIKEQQADILFMLGMLPETTSNTFREAIFR